MKLKISANKSDDYSFIAISSHLKDYRLTFLINSFLGLHFKRIDDLIKKPEEETLSYSLYSYAETDHRIQLCLINNHHPEGKLLPSLKQTDYFFVVMGALEKAVFEAYIKKLKRISGILTAYEVSPETEKQILPLVGDIEMHLLNSGKG